MDITPEQMAVYRASARKRDQEEEAQLEARKVRAWELAREGARILKEEFGATRVVVFGSLVELDRFHLRSDIDMAVWDVRTYFRALGRLLDLDPAFEFDLVPFEDARPGILEAIERQGVDL